MTSCDNTRDLCYIIIPVSKTEHKCEEMRDGCSEEEIDDDETVLCLDIDLSGLLWQWPVSWTASVQLPVRQPWPPTACHTGNARPGMGPSCCLPNVANLFLNQTSQLKDENKKFSIPLNFETRDQLSLSHHLRTKSSYFQ